ncbi:MAG: hypothetical protein IPI46_09600 [Bacteroidetes bacterium]|nr:hypothetical protein [Bacteroidota bacterium]
MLKTSARFPMQEYTRISETQNIFIKVNPWFYLYADMGYFKYYLNKFLSTAND